MAPPVDWAAKLAAFNEERGRTNLSPAADAKEMLQIMLADYHYVINVAYLLGIHENTLHEYFIKFGLRKRRLKGNRLHPMRVEQIRRMAASGIKKKKIAEVLGVCGPVVRKYLRNAATNRLL